MDALERLCEAVRVISPQGEIRFRGGPNGHWIGSVAVGGVILAEVDEGEPAAVVDALTKKLERMSQRMMARLTIPPPDGEPPPST